MRTLLAIDVINRSPLEEEEEKKEGEERWSRKDHQILAEESQTPGDTLQSNPAPDAHRLAEL